ncbi:MAG TPA: hypothetical protein VNA16_08805 [Abditibacteriaceae bacterium]|nr:hypothetical protein [Abditibacteriaceae bacterium]
MSDFNLDSTNTPSESTDCAGYELLLTALFDGEATREQIRFARAHLEACARCADTWAAWSRTRNLLRASFAPAPPPGLLLRILLACRLSALPRKTRRCGVSPEVLPLPLKLETDFSHFSHTADELALTHPPAPAPMLQSVLAPPAPSHLHDDILRRTVGRSLSSREVVDGTQVAGSTDRSSLRQRAGTAARHASRYLPSMAVPALIAWIMFSTMQFSTVQFSTVQPSRLATTPQVRKPAPAALRQSTPPVHAHVAVALPRPAPAQPAARLAVVATAAARVSARPEVERVNVDQVNVERVNMIAEPQPARHALASPGPARVEASAAPTQPRAVYAVRRTSAAPRAVPAPASRPVRPFITRTSWSPARLAGARTEAARIIPAGFPMKVGSKAGFQPRQTSPARFASAPVALPLAHDGAPSSDAASDDDGALDAVRYVVDDFRVALADDAVDG